MEVTPIEELCWQSARASSSDQEHCSQRKGRGAPWGSHDLARMAYDESKGQEKKKNT